MELRIENDGDLVLASVVGVESLDASNAASVREEFEQKLVNSKNVVLSIASVQSIDSAGIGALVTVLKMIRKNGGRLALVGVNPQVYSVLDMIRLTTIFEILPDERAARTALAPLPSTR